MSRKFFQFYQFLCYTYIVMDIKQKIELRHHLVPELSQSLNILALPLLDIKALVEKELEGNPLLEELRPPKDMLNLGNTSFSPPFYPEGKFTGPDSDYRASIIANKVSLQDLLLRQLGMFTDCDEEFSIGQEIIGNIDENGYLKVELEAIVTSLNVGLDKVEKVLRLIQDFEPAGVGARTAKECLLIQLRIANERDPLLIKIIEDHLEDVAKKKYSLISRALQEPPEKIDQLIKKILRLNPKPGCNFTMDETQHVIPDIIIKEKNDEEKGRE